MGSCQLRETTLTEEHRSYRSAAGCRVNNPTQKKLFVLKSQGKGDQRSHKVAEPMMMMMTSYSTLKMELKDSCEMLMPHGSNTAAPTHNNATKIEQQQFNIYNHNITYKATSKKTTRIYK
jgi:hypothetical protein